MWIIKSLYSKEVRSRIGTRTECMPVLAFNSIELNSIYVHSICELDTRNTQICGESSNCFETWTKNQSMNRQLICRYRNKRRAPRFREIKLPSSLICKWHFGDENRCHLSSTCRSVHLRFSWTYQYFCHFEVRSKNWLIHNWTWSQKMNHQVTVEDMERNIVSLQITSQLGLKSEYGSSTRCSRHTHSHAVCDVVAEDRSRGT